MPEENKPGVTGAAGNPETDGKSGKGHGRRGGKQGGRGFGGARSKFNDVAWYVIDPAILKNFCNLAFSNMLGLPVQLGNVPQKSVISQLMTINYVPTIGRSDGPTSGYNLAIRNLYTVVRHKNSGHTNYESPDLGFYLFATTEVVCSLIECERALSLVNSYLVKNRNLPVRLLSALGFSASDLAANAATYRGRINTMLSRVSSLCIPKEYKYFLRRTWMASNLFKDHESTKAIAIAFKSQGIWMFTPTEISTGGALKFYRWANLDSDYLSDRLDKISEALDAITEDEDMNIMSGDILKAFGSEGCQKYAFLGENSQLFPAYVEEMLPQIHNMVTLPSYNGTKTRVMFKGTLASASDASAISTSSCDAWIIQRDGYAVFEPCAGDEKAIKLDDDKTVVAGVSVTDLSLAIPHSVTSRLFLNSFKEDPQPEDVMISTRLRTNYSFSHYRLEKGDDVQNMLTIDLDSFGSEIVEDFSIGILTNTSPYYSVNQYNSIGILTETYWAQASICQSLIAYGAQLAQIDWAPITYNFVLNPVSGVITHHTFFGDLDNYTLLDDDKLEKMHESAVQAEFTTPVIAEFKPRA